MTDIFDFMADFDPDFSKSYDIKGNKFDVQIQEAGNTYDHPSSFLPVQKWLFAIVVNGHRVEGGPFHVDNRIHGLTNENVANRIASFWGESDVVKKAQGLPPKFDLDKIMWKCAEYTKKYIELEEDELFEFDCLQKDLQDGDWFIIISPHPTKNMKLERIFTFNGTVEGGTVRFARYVQEGIDHNATL